MLRLVYTLLLFALVTINAKAQAYWMQSIGGNNVDESMSVCKDANGNFITAGYFTNTANFCAPAVSLTSASIGVPDIYIQKTGPNGNVLWQTKAGGNATDRAMAVATDAAGNIYITGFYYSTATFGSFSLSSVNGSQDAFVAKLDANGNFIWVKSAGGNNAEWGNSIAVDNAGNIFVTGQFKGTTNWGSISKTSVNNPLSGLPSFDIFTAKYDNNGNELWVETGAAEFDDRGLDVAVDNNGNVFVCGQFSDTITFNQVHNNPSMNAVFLIKYNTNGVEQWFRKASASYSIAYALCIDNLQNIYLTGDFQGTMGFYGPPNNFISNTYSNAFFVAKYSNAGSFLWADSDGSNSYVSSRDCAVDPQNNVYLLGEYGCVMDEYSQVYGPGTFNSIGFQDLFCVKYSDSGTRDWFRNFGGPKNDKAHGIVMDGSEPVITGSYEHRFNIPSSGVYFQFAMPILISQGGGAPQGVNLSLCNDNNYFYYQGFAAAGFSDAVLFRGIDLSREPYDYYNHYSASCTRDFVGTCITDYMSYFSCKDTIELCNQGKIFANTNTGSQGFIGPLHHFQWTTQAWDTLQYKQVNTSGTYTVSVVSIDGCFSDTDSVYVWVHPLPQRPHITDDMGFNTNQPPATDTILGCLPDSVSMFATNLQGCVVNWWYAPQTWQTWGTTTNYGGTQFSSNDSVSVAQPGFYTCVLTDSFGCTNHTPVWVKFDTILMLEPWTDFPDSVEACYGDVVYFNVYDSITNPTGTGLFFCFKDLFLTWQTNPAFSMYSQNPQQCTMSGYFYATMPSGTYTINEMIVRKNYCQNDTFWLSKTFYIQVNPKPTGIINFSGSDLLCPGDTNYWVNTFTTSPVNNVQGQFINGADSMTITAPGYYLVSLQVTDTITGCTNIIHDPHYVAYKPDPVIATVPANGIICPNDSALVYTTALGQNYEWHGPTGLLSSAPNGPNIYDSIPGFYHLVYTDNDGCVLTSNTVELKEYSTPYMEAQPQNVICNGQSVTLQVVTPDPNSITWLPPLSGNSLTQTVSQPGVYQCNVTMCGITTLCSVTVTVSNPQAAISASAGNSFCPGDSVLLSGNTGNYVYSWLPGNVSTQSLYVNTAGIFTLTVTDQYGCNASDTVHVSLNTSTAVPSGATSYSVCYGDSVLLTVNAGGLPVEWYADAQISTLIATATGLIIPDVMADTIVYASAVAAGGCNSTGLAVSVDVNDASFPPSVNGDTLVCTGTTFNITGNSPASGAQYSWNGPSGFTSFSQTITVSNATPAASGVYTLTTSGGGCVSSPVTWTVLVVTPLPPVISASSDTVCQMDTLTLVSGLSNATQVYWTSTPGFAATGDTVSVTNPFLLSGWYFAYAEYGNNCQSTADSFFVAVNSNPPFANPVASGTPCPGDSVMLFADSVSGVSYVWSGPGGFTSVQQNPVLYNVSAANAGTYTLYTEQNACKSILQNITLNVAGAPLPYLGPDTSVCSGDFLLLDPGNNFSSYVWSNNTTDTFLYTGSGGIIWVEVSDSNGCSAIDSVSITLLECTPSLTNVFTPNGDGTNDLFSFQGEKFTSVQCKIFNRWGVLVYEWTGVNGAWNGTNMKSGKPEDDGTYYYVAEVADKFGKTHHLHNYITLSR